MSGIQSLRSHSVERDAVGSMTEKHLAEMVQLISRYHPIAVAVLDMGLNYLYASEQWYTHLDIEEPSVVGRSHYDIFPQIVSMPDWLETVQMALDGEETENFRDRVQRKDGRYQYLHWVVKPWYDSEDGIQGGIIMYVEDVTQRVEQEQAKSRLIEELRGEIQQRKRAEKKLRHLATTDELTGIYNRRYLKLLCESELKRSKRYDFAMAVLLVDVDHFKSVNDTFDHLTGDKVLVETAECLGRHIRDTDQVGRWGGEEFLILLPHTDADMAKQLAERVRMSIESHTFPAVKKMTVSIGGACSVSGDTLDSLIKRADTCLYRAKNAGRNRVEVDTVTV